MLNKTTNKISNLKKKKERKKMIDDDYQKIKDCQ